MDFPEPKLKRKRGAGGLRSLPAEKEASGASSKCTGVLVGGSVLVHDAADIETLSRDVYGSIRAGPLTGASSHECSGGGGPTRKRPRENDTIRDDGERKVRLILREERRKKRAVASLEHGGVTRETRGGACGGGLQSKIAGFPEKSAAVDEMDVSKEMELSLQGDLIAEPLCLSSEEAFYLAAETDRLAVHTPTDTTRCLTAEELWQHLCSNNHRLPFTYTAYRHYHRRGWVAKSGIKFGVDFVLYKDGPEFYHSSYAVLVCEQIGRESSRAECGEGGLGQGEGERQLAPEEAEGYFEGLRWMDTIAHCRVSESTAKDLVVCHVTPPSGCGETRLLSSPTCVEHMSISETLVARWLPDRDR